MLVTGDGRTPRRGAMLPGPCPSRRSRKPGSWCGELCPVISMPLQIERGLKCGGEWALAGRLHISAAPSTPYPREIAGPPCMIRFLNSRLAAAPRGSMFCLLSLLMEQFCLGCSAAHYSCTREPGDKGHDDSRCKTRTDFSRLQSCASTVTGHQATRLFLK